MRHLTVGIVLALLLGGCAQTEPPSGAGPSHGRVGFISEPGSDGAATPEQAAARLAGVTAALIDPPRDSAYPARNRQLVVRSGPVRPELGRPAEMNAVFFAAAGAGPKPTMLLLHGLPGNERNLDLAQAVRRAGWNVLTFTYRGAWGSEGMFSIQHAVEDSHSAMAWLRSGAAVRDFGVDPARIVVAGHSMGGFMAARVAARDHIRREAAGEAVDGPPIAGVILIDAWDIAAEARRAGAAGEAGRASLTAAFDDVGHSLGPITAADIADNILRRGAEWDLTALAPALARTRVLTVYATHGDAEANRGVAEAIGRACRVRAGARPGCNGMLTAVEMDTDHAFADHRVALAREVVGWLERR
jgi:pimeloyl-ACP methyl ester carboxylesterase